MKLVLCIVLVALATLPLVAGNGAPVGNHYNLNILGKVTCSGDDLTGSNRHTIQVLLNFDDGSQNGQLASTVDKRNKIYLQEGPFQVLDGNACDNGGAKFQLPANPYTCPVDDPNCLNTDPTFQAYLVYIRALGKPGGSARMTTCATGAGDDGVLGTADDEIVCSTESVLLVRSKGKSSFTNVTKQLTTLCLDTNADNVCDTRVGIFDDSLYDYMWDFDNNGLRLTQLRFYPLPD